jgi:quinoprotein glucose dehydrogenase
MRMHLGIVLSAAVLGLFQGGGAPSGGPMQPWPVYAADDAATHYSPLADINRGNVGRLGVAWEWQVGEDTLPAFGTRPGNFQNTPLMIDGVLYVSTPYNRVVALDPETGRERWSFDPKPYEDGQPPNGTGFVHRGVAAWRDGGRLRIFVASRYRLISLDATTGEPVSSFGTQGTVNLTAGLRREVDRRHYTNTSPPVVYRDLVIVGNGVGDRLMYRNDPPGDVRAFDARTGRLVWSFHTVPMPGEFGHDTWGDESWRFTGHTNVWAPMSVDAGRGLVYLPVTTPSNDYYGGRRPGANVFAESLVCLDANTGERRWHYQIVHHGLWDYDLPAAPILVTIPVAGRPVEAVVQLTKQGFAFAFDRVTGQPIWPIEERAVPASDVPGERAWPTQPFPTKPAAFAPQGAGAGDVFDLTPELRTAAIEALKRYRAGPLYTPPSVAGTILRPGIIGGANWGGGSFDPETGMLYVKTSNQAFVVSVVEPDRSASNPRASEVDADLIGRSGSATFTPPAPEGFEGRMPSLPLFKPPYGELVAIDLNTGEIAWRVPAGDMASVREHPLLRDVALPARLGAPGAPGNIVTAGGLVFVGGGDSAFRAFDKATGREVWTFDLPRRATGTPMTYRTASGRQYVLIATGGGRDAALVAFTLQERRLASLGAAAFEEQDVAPDAAEPAQALAAAHDPEAAALVQGDAGHVLREDAGLQRPEAMALGRGDQRVEQRAAQAPPAAGLADVDAHFGHARVDAAVGYRAERRPAGQAAVTGRHQPASLQVPCVPPRPVRHGRLERGEPGGDAFRVDPPDRRPVVWPHRPHRDHAGMIALQPSVERGIQGRVLQPRVPCAVHRGNVARGIARQDQRPGEQRREQRPPPDQAPLGHGPRGGTGRWGAGPPRAHPVPNEQQHARHGHQHVERLTARQAPHRPGVLAQQVDGNPQAGVQQHEERGDAAGRKAAPREPGEQRGHAQVLQPVVQDHRMPEPVRVRELHAPGH